MQRKPKIKQKKKKKTEWVSFSQFSLSVLNSIRLCLQSICIPRAYKIMFFYIIRLVEGGDLQLQQEKGRRQL